MARPALFGCPPIARNEKSMKNFPAPEAWSTAPKIVNSTIRLDDTSTAEPKMPSRVM